MLWLGSDLLSASVFGLAYTCVYYLTNKLKLSSLVCGCLVKLMGCMLITLIMLYYYSYQNKPIVREVKYVLGSPFVILVLLACSAMWFTAEVLLYETLSIAPQPAYATAVWNLAPLPVFLLSLHFSKSHVVLEQFMGIGCILLAVYFINI